MITLKCDCMGLLRRKENWDWRKDTSLKGFKINNFLRDVGMFVLESSLKVFDAFLGNGYSHDWYVV